MSPLRNDQGGCSCSSRTPDENQGAQPGGESELTRSNHRFRCLADASDRALLYFEGEICLEANQAAAGMFGADTPSGLKGRKIAALLSPESAASFNDRAFDIPAGSHTAVGIRDEGIRFPVDVKKVHISCQGDIETYVLSIKDVTRENRLKKINNTMFAISNAVNTTLDLDDLYGQIHHLLSDIIDVTNFFIAIVNNERNTIHFPYYVDTEDSDFSTVMEFDMENSLTGLVVLHRKPMLLDRKSLRELRKEKNAWGPESLVWMGVPLMIKDEVIGVIVVQSYSDPHLYTHQELRILASVSDQVAIAIDRKRAEDSLREREKKYRQLFDNAPAGIFEIDFTIPKFINVNQIMCAYVGYSAAEFLAMEPADLFAEDGKDLLQNILTGHQRPGNVECHLRKKNRDTLCVLLNNDFIFEDGKLIRSRVVVHDITERKKMERLIIQSEKMMSIGGLAAGMAHEINNPLAGMMQNAQLIINRLSRNLPANDAAAEKLGTSMTVIKEYMAQRDILQKLEYINEAGGRAAKVIENMLSFVKTGSAVKDENSLDDIIEKTLEIAQTDYDLKKRYDFKKIKLTRVYQPDVKTVLCEESKIQQVLFNVLKNAAESMASKPPDTMPELVIRLGNSGDMVCVEIEDNGPGIDPATQKRIFEPFFTTKNVDLGTGLGLSVSYFIIVEDHGGEMGVASVPGKGATFRIKLPVYQSGS